MSQKLCFWLGLIKSFKRFTVHGKHDEMHKDSKLLKLKRKMSIVPSESEKVPIFENS